MDSETPTPASYARFCLTNRKTNAKLTPRYQTSLVLNSLHAMRLILLLTCITGGLWAQTSTPPIPPATQRKAAVNKDNLEPPLPPPTRYLTGDFDPMVEQLGANFFGHDPEAVITVLKQSDANTPKSEFETTAQYEARQKESHPDSRTLVFVFGDPEQRTTTIGQGPAFKYDADTQIMSAGLVSRERSFGHQVVNSKKFHTLTATHVLRSRKEYVGTNAFGASVTITEIRIDEYGIILENFSDVFAPGVGPLNRLTHEVEAQISLPMSIDMAKELKPNLRLAIICRLNEAKVYRDFALQTPTISDPYDSYTQKYYASVTPEQLMVFDQKTGKILMRVGKQTK